MSNIYKFFFAILVFSLVTGCNILAVEEQQQKVASFCQFLGVVKPEIREKGLLVVVLFRHKGGTLENRNNWNLVDHYVLEKAGRWSFYARPGTYELTAFQDIDQNRIFERNEPAIPLDNSKIFSCTEGEVKSDMNLIIPHQGRIPGDSSLDISKLQLRSVYEQLNVSLGQSLAIGEVISLDDQRFSRENAKKGLWRPADFIWESKPGIYFLQNYDQEKTPVLFIHGINGTPRDFNFFINHLNTSLFQPWVFYYPSGGHLEPIATNLSRLITQLKAQHRFQNLFIVAHSMGGLIARDSILHYTENTDKNLISLFVSIATPWNGDNAAQLAADHSPVTVSSWLDMAPSSQFLSQLFYTNSKLHPRRLPSTIYHHLIFTFLLNESGDSVVSLESQLRQEAQNNATRIYGFMQSHTGILEDTKTSDLLNRLFLDNENKAF